MAIPSKPHTLQLGAAFRALDVHPASSLEVAVAVDIAPSATQIAGVRGRWSREEAAGLSVEVAAISDHQCHALKFMPDGQVLLSASGSKVQLLDADRLFVGAEFQSAGQGAMVTGLAVCGHTAFAAGDSEGGVHLWDLRQRHPVRCLQHMSHLEEGKQLHMCFSERHGSLVLAGGRAFSVHDLKQPVQGYKEQSTPALAPCRSVAACGMRGGDYLMLGCSDGRMHRYKWDSWAAEYNTTTIDSNSQVCSLLPFDDTMVVSAVRSGSVTIHQGLGDAAKHTWPQDGKGEARRVMLGLSSPVGVKPFKWLFRADTGSKVVQLYNATLAGSKLTKYELIDDHERVLQEVQDKGVLAAIAAAGIVTGLVQHEISNALKTKLPRDKAAALSKSFREWAQSAATALGKP